MKEQILREYGLSENEVRVYLSNLMVGTARANLIAKKARLLRTTTYEVLRSLVEKGLASYVIRSGVKYFDATDPHKLLMILEEHKEKISSILPELESIRMSVREKPTVQTFEGKAGLKAILDDIIRSHPKEILQLNSAKIFDTLQFYFPQWIKRRITTKIPTRILQEKVKIIEDYKRTDKHELREIRFLPEHFKITTTNFIYNNKIAMLTLNEEEIIGVVIEHSHIVETQRSLFEILWNSAKK